MKYFQTKKVQTLIIILNFRNKFGNMQKGIIILIFISILSLSCSTSRISNSYRSYENCLPKSFKNDLDLIVKSFDDFVERNYDGHTNLFLSAIINREFPKIEDFNRLDFEVANRLKINNFRDFIYTKFEENLSDSEFEVAPPKTANPIEKESRMLIKVDKDKPYLNCLSNIKTKGKLIRKYVELRKKDSFFSPLIVGDLFLRNSSDNDYDTKMAKIIIAVELYFMILDSATKYTSK